MKLGEVVGTWKVLKAVRLDGVTERGSEAGAQKWCQS